MKVSNYQLSCLCNDAYSDNSTSMIIDETGIKYNWIVDSKFCSRRIGFACNLYFLESNNLLSPKVAVLAFRGTEVSDLDDLLNDAAIAVGSLPPQALFAIQVAKEAKAYYSGLILTGHSLGGALAIIASAHTDTEAITFNAPGTESSCFNSSALSVFEDRPIKSFLNIVKNCSEGAKVNNIKIGGDMVSIFLLKQVGTTTTLMEAKCDGQFNYLCKHEIGTITDTIKNRPARSGSW